MTMSPYEAPAAQELEVRRGAPVPDLITWAMEAGDVHKVAQMLAATSFVPKVLQGRPDEIAAQILYGREVGMSPMVALQHINIIEGRASLSALSMRGLAQSAGVKFRLDEATETRCRYSAMAPGDRDWTTVTWTLDQAKKLDLASKKNWQKQPGAMLIARATSQLCRLVAAPMFLGLPYSTEELQDGVTALPEPAAQPPEEPAKTRTVKRAPLKATASVPGTPHEDPGYSESNVPKRPLGVPVEHRPDMVGDSTRKALMASFNDVGIKDRATRLSYVSDLLGREVDSVNQCSEDEGRRILDQLRIDFPKQLKHGNDWDDVETAEVGAS